jgi:hypothetical protein
MYWRYKGDHIDENTVYNYAYIYITASTNNLTKSAKYLLLRARLGWNLV